MTRDEFKRRFKDFAQQFHRVASDELRGTPWLFWSLLVLAVIGIMALLRWVL